MFVFLFMSYTTRDALMMTSNVETCRFIKHFKFGCFDYILLNNVNECADYGQRIAYFVMKIFRIFLQ